ncbi:uroporphyrinogen-III synthase [Marinirhabdus gelatinilytica]|uniref:Uroporphyrinogen-III synthase n=1 Tax=Marinirhabdus gelatinilytica TaxID=1703343 RepID=A0A370QJT2_9FLAO|nr:uroporphyrinogen-III synthase [Marinirhabdus gelatinilytica]RDK88596.1 uroporphyrinogen-III synthase [Marinirhabdus gelatinilytica]
MKILSTKKLKPNQRDLLLGAGLSVVDYDAISIRFLDSKIPSEVKNAIFTSQNGVKSFLKNLKTDSLSLNKEVLGMKVLCVGQKTKTLLEENGLKVTKKAKNSAELAQFIVKNHQNETFHYFCGSERRDELPNILKEAKINFFETKTYKTTLNPRKFDQKWDGILFFSPSGLKSYVSKNSVSNAIAICIGPTTADAAKKYFKNVVIANSTSVESVIAKTVKTLK